MKHVSLFSNVSWQLLALRRTVDDLLSYWYQPAAETESTGWRDSVQESVKDSFRDAMDVGELVAMIGRDTLTDRRTDALTLVGIMHANAGMTRREWGADVPNEVTALREFAASLEATERMARDESERAADPEPEKPEPEKPEPEKPEPEKPNATTSGADDHDEIEATYRAGGVATGEPLGTRFIGDVFRIEKTTITRNLHKRIADPRRKNAHLYSWDCVVKYFKANNQDANEILATWQRSNK